LTRLFIDKNSTRDREEKFSTRDARREMKEEKNL